MQHIPAYLPCHPHSSLTSHITVTTFSRGLGSGSGRAPALGPGMLGNVGGRAWHHTVAHCSLAPALHLQCHNQRQCSPILWTDCSLVPTINTLSLCCAFAGSLFAEGACTRAILTDEVFCHRQLGGECAQCWTRVKAPEFGAPRLCARCVRVSTQHTAL